MKTIKQFLATRPANTKRVYKYALVDFALWIWKYKRRRYADATIKDASEYLTRMIRSSASATVAVRHSALSSYFTYLEAIEEVKRNPFRLVKKLLPARQKHQVRPTATLNVKIVRNLLKLPAKNTREGVRDSAIMAALLGGGLRRSEVLKLNLEDIVVTVKGSLIMRLKSTKAGDDSQQVLRGNLAARITALVALRKTEGAENEDPLIICYRSGRRMSESTLYRLFKAYAKKAGIKAAPHSARAAAITKLLEDGFSLLDVKKFARHAGWHTIETYDHRRLNVDKAPQPKFF